MAHYHIVLANNHAPLRECLKRILSGNSDLEVIGEAGDSLELLNLLNLGKVPAHMVILDLSLPNLTRDVIHKLRAIQPDVRVLTLSMHKDREYFGQAIINGAEGYLLKENVDRELLPAIEKIRRGGVYIPSGILPN
ncbi:MAG TPA: response regulator transcription factor [Thermodesulfobacteriota bacterium]|nr:response regulator transcription factor [Thermodesulfobacteriota bacterium]